MSRWGLVIGSAFDDPRGVENDTRLIGDVLAARGFEVETLIGPRATRAQILAACDVMTVGARPGDAVVIYYSGYGALVTDPPRAGELCEGPQGMRVLCPSDYGASSDGDFCGIALVELSRRLAALAARTGNVTAILDCSYVAPLCRGAGASGRRARAVEQMSRFDISGHLKSLGETDALDGAREVSNVVWISAAGGSGGAFPVRLPASPRWIARGRGRGGDGFVGALTLALCELLDEIGGAGPPWAALLPALRGRVRAHGDGQQPAIEGAIRRAPFERVEGNASRVPVERRGAGFVLRAGRLAGVSVGDVYEVREAREVRPPDSGGQVLAHATVDAVTALSASGDRLEWSGEARELPSDAVAIVRELAFERRAVRVIAREPHGARIAAALGATGRLRVAGETDREVLAEVELCGDRLVIRDGEEVIFEPVPYPVGLGDAAGDLANLALVQRLRGLPEDQGVARSDVEVVWGTVVGGAEQPRPDHGFALGLDDVIYLRARNLSARALHAHVFHIGPRGRIALLSSFELAPHGERTLGADIDERLRGIPVVWPLGLARSAPGLDTLLAIFTAAPADLRMLESSAQRVARGDRIELAPYAMVWCDYWLFPLRTRLAAGELEIDDKPFGIRAIAPGAAGVSDVRLRLRDVELRDVEPRGAETRLRIDTLVCTRARRGALPYRARTLRWPSGAQAGRLALDDGVLWSGYASELLDVYVWLSRDDAGAADLADLLRLASGGVRLRDAVAALCDGAAPRAASIASAASTAIGSFAGELLARAMPGVIGVYRGSLAIDGCGDGDLLASVTRCCARHLAFALELEGEREGELDDEHQRERDLAIARLPSDSNRRPTAYEAVATTS